MARKKATVNVNARKQMRQIMGDEFGDKPVKKGKPVPKKKGGK